MRKHHLTLKVPTSQNGQRHSNNSSVKPTNFLSVFDHFVRVTLKRLSSFLFFSFWYRTVKGTKTDNFGQSNMIMLWPLFHKSLFSVVYFWSIRLRNAIILYCLLFLEYYSTASFSCDSFHSIHTWIFSIKIIN